MSTGLKLLLMIHTLALLPFLMLSTSAEVNELTIVETESNEEVTAESDVKDQSRSHINLDRIFIPTGNWQTVEPDQTVLPGLHYRMNLQTGLKEAKLMDGDDGTEYSKYLTRLRTTGRTGIVGYKKDQVNNEDQRRLDEIKARLTEALKNIHGDDEVEETEMEKSSKIKSKFRSYEELRQDFHELQLNVESDMEIVKRLIDDYLIGDNARKEVILEDLEYLVHQIDNAIYFVDIGGLETIVKPGINSSSSIIRQSVLQLLGSAAQSNAKVQIAALEAGLLQPLLLTVAFDSEEVVSRRGVFALSCLVRGFPYGQQALLQNGGLQVLRKVLDRRDSNSLSLQIKVVSLISDLLTERVEGAVDLDRLSQLAQVDLHDTLVSDNWCLGVSALLSAAAYDRRDLRYDLGAALKEEFPVRPNHDIVDKIVNAMTLLADSCAHQYRDTLPLLSQLATTYEDLAYKEQLATRADTVTGLQLFKELTGQIRQLISAVVSTSGRDEL